MYFHNINNMICCGIIHTNFSVMFVLLLLQSIHDNLAFHMLTIPDLEIYLQVTQTLNYIIILLLNDIF